MKNILKRIYHWNLSTKIIFLFLMNAGLALFISSASEQYLKMIGKELHDVVTVDMPIMIELKKAKINKTSEMLYFEKILNYNEKRFFDSSYDKKYDGALKNYQDSLAMTKQNINESIELIESNLNEEHDQSVLKKISDILEVLKVINVDNAKTSQEEVDIIKLINI